LKESIGPAVLSETTERSRGYLSCFPLLVFKFLHTFNPALPALDSIIPLFELISSVGDIYDRSKKDLLKLTSIIEDGKLLIGNL
jgi:hypothetical protein